MTRTRYAVGVSAGALMMALGVAGPAAAQVPPSAAGQSADSPQTPPADQNNAGQITDIVVTAEKRSENVQSVPLSITAVTGDTLREQHVTQLQDLRFIDPSLNYKVSTGPGTSAFAVRGIGTSSFSSGIEQSVSTVLDGVVLGDPSAVQTLADIDRVEILRGPQGMLFGKNASSGVVSINTTDPKLNTVEGLVHLSYGENNEAILQGIANLPIGDTVAVRLVATYNHLDGWVTDPALGGRGINPINIAGVRGKIRWQPNDRLDAVLAVDESYTGEFCCSQVVRYAPDPHTGVAVSDRLLGIVAGPANFQVGDGAAPTGFGRVLGASLNISYNLGGGYSLASITGFRKTIRSNFYDADFATFNFADVNGGSQRNQNYSEELRLASPVGKLFDFVAGVFAYQSRIAGVIGQEGYFNNPSFDTVVIPAAQQVFASDAQTSTVTNQDYAVYGQGRIHFTDQLSAILGGRVTRDTLQLHYTEGGLVPGLPLRGGYPASGFASNSYIGYAGPYVTPCVTPAQAVLPARPNCFPAIDQETNATNFSWRLGLQEQINPDVLAYATVSRGYKGPGFSGLTITASNIVNNQADQRIRPEIPTSYEIGLKSRFFDRRLVFNIDAFKTDYRNFQAQVSTPTPNGFVSQIANAGQVKVSGVEVAITAKPVAAVTLSAGGTYLHARYGDFAGVSCYSVLANANTGATALQPGCNAAAGNTINAKGNRLSGAPDWQYTLGAGYDRPDTLGSLALHARADWFWQDSVEFAANGDPLQSERAYGLLGGELGVGPRDDRWRISLYGTNILNRHWAANVSPAPTAALNPAGIIQYFSEDSFRHLGVRLDARF